MNLRHIFILVATAWSWAAFAQSSSRIVIQGPPSFGYRLEIHDFVKNKQFFTLYIRALQSFQNVAESKDASFFGVGGIHGLPYVTWNGANGGFPGNNNPNWTFGGYCTHGAEIFPTWHRPYVSLYEQLLQSTASQIATQFTVNQTSWVQAAQQLRQPYWDWATYALPPNEVIRNATVTITGFDGRDVSVTNPLLRYKFQAKLPLPYFSGTQFANEQTTLRQPDANGKENINRLVSILTTGFPQTRTDTYLLLANVHDWDGFSNHDSSENAITNSLESIHDNLHVEIGGNGHMAFPDVAGFDPIFFLHHCQVDRVITLWSALNPGVWVVSGHAPDGGTYTIPPNATIDTNTDLTPFWNSQTTFWESSETTNTTQLGYAYADFQGIDLNDPQAVRNKVVSIVQGLNSTSSVAARALPVPTPTNGTQILNWSLRLRANHNELHHPYTILVFIGDVPSDSSQWLESPTLVGIENSFASVSGGGHPAGALSESFIHLNAFIAANHPELGSYDADVITPFLKNNLAWRVVDTTYSPVQLNSLEVTAFSVPLTWNTGASFPTASTGQIQYYPNVTQGGN